MDEKRKKKLLVIGVLVGVIGVGAIVVAIVRSLPPTTKPPIGTVVRISEDGFEPRTITIKRGTAVVWKNDDTEAHRVAANPFPSHDELPSLDSKNNIPPGGDYSYTFSQKGTFHYHDELIPSNNATVIVQ